MNNSISSVMDLFIIACGVYVLYVFYMLKYKGEIKETLLLPKGLSAKKCKDKAAYTKEMAPKVLIYGLAVTLCGVMGAIEDVYGFLGSYYPLVLVVFVAVSVWFASKVKKANQKYW